MMNAKPDRAYVLELNRVKRAYTGGKLLDEWQGLENPKDGHFPEEFLISTVEVTNETKSYQEGVSKTTLEDGSLATIKDMISSDYEGFLGAKYAAKKDLMVSARVGDGNVRIVLQCHPDQDFARKYLKFPNGKNEAWYILKTRKINNQDPYLLAGFKKGVTRDKWRELFEKQDIDGMIECMHKIPIHEGGVYFVEAGMPHALGEGAVFLEMHEPCDYTFRTEKKYLDIKTFSDYEVNYGLGNELMLDAFHYDTYTYDEIIKKCVLNSKQIFKTDKVSCQNVGSLNDIRRFSIDKYTFSENVELPEFDGHRIAITIDGDTTFKCGSNDSFAKQGRGVLLPANAKKMTLVPEKGKSCSVLICNPPTTDFDVKRAFDSPIQIGILVNDLDSTLEKLEKDFGMGPWRIAEYPPKGESPYMEYHGKPGNFRAKFCFYSYKNIELEVIQPLEGDNIWQDWIDKHGPGIHHIKFLVDEHESAEEYLNSKGYKIYQQGASVGPNTGKVWAFYDTYDSIGFDIELMNRLIK
jgi:mannose-6-phosphate isomerase